MPGAAKSCAVQTSPKSTKIYEANRKTEAREGEILSRAVIVEIRYDAEIKPELTFISENKAKKISSSTSC